MVATARDLLAAALELKPDERKHLARELLASVGEGQGDEDEGVDDSEALRAEVIRRANDVRDGRAVLCDGPTSLRAIRERLQNR